MKKILLRVMLLGLLTSQGCQSQPVPSQSRNQFSNLPKDATDKTTTDFLSPYSNIEQSWQTFWEASKKRLSDADQELLNYLKSAPNKP